MPRALTSGDGTGLNTWILRLQSSRRSNAGAAVVVASFLRFLGFMFAASMIVFIAVAGAAAFVLWKVSSELPDYEVLAKYEPPVMTRIHANDGELIADFSRERRIYVPITAIPKCVIEAFISAEDKNFYQHGGLDVQGIIRAVVTNLSNVQSGRRVGRRLDHHPAGGQEFPPDQRPDHRAQAERGDPRHPHRARLHQGADPRALSQRDLSRRRRLWRGGRGADLLGQGSERADARRLRLSCDAAQGAEQLRSVQISPTAPSPAATG